MRPRIGSAVAAAIAVLSCTSPTEPLANVHATVVRHVVARNVDGSVGRVDATFRIVIENRSARVVYYSGGCAVSLERQDADLRWKFVLSPLCTLAAPANPLDGMLQIPAGSSTEASVRMSAYGNDQGWPSVGLDGTYRLRVTIASPLPVAWRGMMGVQYNSQSLPTNEFALTLAPS